VLVLARPVDTDTVRKTLSAWAAAWACRAPVHDHRVYPRRVDVLPVRLATGTPPGQPGIDCWTAVTVAQVARYSLTVQVGRILG
jgi:hypothetical protein